MQIKNVNYKTRGNKAVLSGELIFGATKNEVCFEVDKKFQNFIFKDASPFLAAALPIAMKKKENIEIDGTISEQLTKGVPNIMKILKTWDLGFIPVSINAKQVNKDLQKPSEIGCFFSGGVDSFYTYFKNNNDVKYLVFVHGFDIPAKNMTLYKKVEKNIAKIAKSEGVTLLEVKTNIRETFEQYFNWDVTHGFAIAAVALFLRKGFKDIYLSCGQPSKDEPHTHLDPKMDKLWSTERMKLIHYGCFAGKIEKIQFLSKKKIAMENLRVCWMNKTGQYNCGKCEKCLRNMLGLYLANSLEECKTFGNKINLEKLRNLKMEDDVLKYFTTIFDEMKKRDDSSEVRIALEESINRNLHPHPQEKIVNSIRKSVQMIDTKYNSSRLFWFLSARGLI